MGDFSGQHTAPRHTEPPHSPLFPRNPHFPALRSGPTAAPGASLQATPISPPSGPAPRLLQGPPSKSKFLAAGRHPILRDLRESPINRFLVIQQILRHQFPDPLLPANHLVLHAVHQGLRQGKAGRGHQEQPIGGQARGHHRHGQNPPLQFPTLRITFQHLPIGQHLRTPDLETLPLRSLQIEHTQQVGRHVADRNRLTTGLQPLRGHHHRQLLHQIADDLKGRRARAHDDRGPQGGERNVPASKDPFHLQPRPQVWRERLIRPLRHDPAQIDDLPHHRPPHRLPKICGRPRFQFLKPVRPGPHRMDQIIRPLQILRQALKGRRIQQIALIQLNRPFREVPQRKPPPVPHQTHHLIPGSEQFRKQTQTHITVGPC